METNIHKQYFGNLSIVFYTISCWLRGALLILWGSWENLELWLNLGCSSLWGCIVSASSFEVVLDVGSSGPLLPWDLSWGLGLLPYILLLRWRWCLSDSIFFLTFYLLVFNSYLYSAFSWPKSASLLIYDNKTYSQHKEGISHQMTSIKSTGYSSKEPRFSFRHPHGSLWTFVTIVPGDLTLSFGLYRQQVCTWGTAM